MKRFRLYVLLLIAVFLFLKLLFLFKYHVPIWDEGVYLGMAKDLYSGGEIGLWEILRPIALPLVIGLPWALGLPILLFSKLIAYLFAAGTMYLTYLIGEKVFGEKIGLLSAALLGFCPLFFLYSGYVLTEIPSVFFILLAIYFWISGMKYGQALAPMSAALAVLFKFPNLLLIGVFLIVLLSAGRKNLFSRLPFRVASFFAIYGLTVLPFLVYNYWRYHAHTSMVHHALLRPFIFGASAMSNPAESVLTGTLLSQFYNLFYYPIVMLRENFILIFLFPGLLFLLKERSFFRKGIVPLWSYALVYLVYFTYIINKQDRFLLLFLPPLAIIAAFGLYRFFGFASHLKRFSGTILYIVVLLLIVSSLVMVVRDAKFYSWEFSEKPAVVSELYEYFERNPVDGAILVSEPVFAAYSDHKFIPQYYAGTTVMDVYAEHAQGIGAVVYTTSVSSCPEDDAYCWSMQQRFLDILEKEYVQVFKGTYHRSATQYVIYLRSEQ